VSWWNSEVSKSLAVYLERFVCPFGQYGSTWMSNMIFLCEHTIVIPRLPCLFRMSKAVPWTVELVNSGTSNSVNLFNFAMWAFASKCSPLSWSHVLMDGEELDDIGYIWCQGCRSPQFRSVNGNTTKAYVSNHSKQQDVSNLQSLKPTHHRRRFVK